MNQRIWLIGGTSESSQIAAAIATLNFPCTITVTTPAAQELYPQHPALKTVVRNLPATEISQFCEQEQIALIIDASHPYARFISQQAIATATQRYIPYLRFDDLVFT